MVINGAEKIIDYSTFFKGINSIKFDFVSSKENVKSFSYRDSYNSIKKKYAGYLKSYRKIVLETIKKVLGLFSGFLKTQKFMLVLNGSFARHSHREYSDIDISFFLDKKKTRNFVVFEELFYYALSFIFGVDRERMNNILSLTMEVDHVNEYDNNIVLMWGDNKASIEYTIPSTSAYIFHKNYVGDRSYSNFVKLLASQLKDDVTAPKGYTFEVLFNNTEYNLYNDVLAIAHKNRNNFIMPQYDITLSNLKNIKLTRDLKFAIKDIFNTELNEFSSYLRHYMVRKDNHIKMLNVNNVLESKYFEQLLGKHQAKLRENFYKYMYYLTRVEICLNKLDIDLSFLDTSPIDSGDLVTLYRNVYKTKENVLAILFDIITENREIYKQVFASL